MHSRGTRSAVAGLVALSAIGIAAIAWTPRWRPPSKDAGAPRRAFVIGIFGDPTLSHRLAAL